MALEDSDNPLLIGKQHIRLKRVNSTNKYATDMVSKSKPIEGTVISASFQYDGRGQIGRFWESEDGMNITCSTILRPSNLDVQDQYYLNIAVGLAVHDFVDHFTSSGIVMIKWPNDIYVDDNKIAGILVQNSLKGKWIDTSIIGTGVNINQTVFSKEIPNPTSIKRIQSAQLDLDVAHSWLFRFLTKRYLQLKAKQYELLNKEYHTYLYRKDEMAGFIRPNKEVFRGKIIGVQRDGRLCIEMPNGTLEKFAFRKITYVR